MDIIIIGSGARECAILMKLLESSKSANFITLGTTSNAFMQLYSVFYLIKDYEIVTLMQTCLFKDEHNDGSFVIIGPEQPIANGLVDVLKITNLKCIAPCMANALIESDKLFARKLIDENDSSYNPDYISYRETIGSSILLSFHTNINANSDAQKIYSLFGR